MGMCIICNSDLVDINICKYSRNVSTLSNVKDSSCFASLVSFADIVLEGFEREVKASFPFIGL